MNWFQRATDLESELAAAKASLAKYQECRVHDVDEKAWLSKEMTEAKAALADALKERDEYRTKGAAHIRLLAVNNDGLRDQLSASQAELATVSDNHLATLKQEHELLVELDAFEAALGEANARLNTLVKAADKVLTAYMPQFSDSRAVDSCLVELAFAYALASLTASDAPGTEGKV